MVRVERLKIDSLSSDVDVANYVPDLFSDEAVLTSLKDRASDEQKEKALAVFLRLGNHPHVKSFTEEYFGVRKHEVVLFFGDVANTKQWSKIQSLMFSTPMMPLLSEVPEQIESFVDAFCDEFEVDWEYKSLLCKFIRRNLRRNSQLLMNIKFIDPPRIPNHMRAEVLSRLVEVHLDIQAEAFSEFGEEAPGSDLRVVLEEARDAAMEALEQRVEARSVKDVHAIMVRIRDNSDLEEEEKARAFMRELVGLPLTNDQLLSVEADSLKHANAFVGRFNEAMASSISLFSQLCPHVERPDFAVPKFDFEVEMASSIYNIVRDMFEAVESGENNPEVVLSAQERQLFILLNKNSNIVFADPSLHDSQTLLYRSYSKINKARSSNAMYQRAVYVSPQGDVSLSPAKGFDETAYEFRMVQIGDEGTIPVYFPYGHLNKERTSTELKVLREGGWEPHQLYDLFRTLEVLDMSVEEMRTEGGKAKIKAYSKKKMSALGLVEAPEGTKRKNLKPGQYLVDFKKLDASGQRKASNGLKVVKIYFRERGSEANDKGVGGEVQLMPLSEWAKYKSPNNILHERFYTPNKLIQFIRMYLSDTRFKDFHAYADYLEACVADLQKRAAKNNGSILELEEAGIRDEVKLIAKRLLSRLGRMTKAGLKAAFRAGASNGN